MALSVLNNLIQIVFLIFVLIEKICLANPGNSYKDLDICSHWNGRRHFLEMGERGDLHAQNVTTSAYRSTMYTPLSLRNQTNTDLWYQCNLELVTCAECVIRVTLTFSNFTKTCDKFVNNGNTKLSTKCPCEHIQFSEPPYDTTVSGQDYCGDGKVFRSKTRTLLLKFFYRATNSHVFSLQYFSERNVQIISGTPKQSIVSNYSQTIPQVILTPYFPLQYPRDYGVEHILTCEAENCRVRLEFTDFQLGLSSTMEIFDSNGQMLDSYNGEHFRPPIVISSGKSLLLQFRGNGVSGTGYRAEVTYISEKQIKDRQLIPFTDCGGMVTGPGGAITMMNMMENTTAVRPFDCIWIIKPGNNYMMMKTHILLRIESFVGMASKSEITIRQGITSDAGKIETVWFPNNGISKKNHIVPITTGYYIRLRGVFGKSSKLAIVYSVFNYLNCYIGSEFLCNNNHCISIRMHCDGFDHCGDGSDEPESCEEEWAHIQSDRRWYSHKPNYYFPKMEQYPDFKTATGIFVMSTLGILAVLSGWMVILYRMGVRARQQRELQNHLQTISEFLDRQEELTSIDEPPVYEAPPDYEDVIKIGMDGALSATRDLERRRHRHPRNQRHGNSRNLTRLGTCTDLNQQVMPNVHQILTPTITSGPSTSSNITSSPIDNIQDIVERVNSATTSCENAESTASIERIGKTTGACHTAVGSMSSNSSISVRGELPNTQSRAQQNSTYSVGTSNQFDECSAGFGDESLNISFSLALPVTNTNQNDLKPQRPKSNVCTENTFLKKSWIVFNNGDQNFGVQRLRHTFSSPGTLFSEYYNPDTMNYGTNCSTDRNSFISNNSVFGSDLSRDPSPTITLNPTETLLRRIRDAEINTEPELKQIGKRAFKTRPSLKFKTKEMQFPEEQQSSESSYSNNLNESHLDNLKSLSSITESTLISSNDSLLKNANFQNLSKHVRSKSFNTFELPKQSNRHKRSLSADILIRRLSNDSIPISEDCPTERHKIAKIYII